MNGIYSNPNWRVFTGLVLLFVSAINLGFSSDGIFFLVFTVMQIVAVYLILYAMYEYIVIYRRKERIIKSGGSIPTKKSSASMRDLWNMKKDAETMKSDIFEKTSKMIEESNKKFDEVFESANEMIKDMNDRVALIGTSDPNAPVVIQNGRVISAPDESLIGKPASEVSPTGLRVTLGPNHSSVGAAAMRQSAVNASALRQSILSSMGTNQSGVDTEALQRAGVDMSALQRAGIDLSSLQRGTAGNNFAATGGLGGTAVDQGDLGIASPYVDGVDGTPGSGAYY